MRILQVIPTYYPAVRYGGPIRSVHGLAAALVKRGHEVHVFTTTMDGHADLDVPLDGPVLMDGVQVHYFRVPALRRLFWSPAMGRALQDNIGDFDVAHLHSVYLWPTLKAARCAEQQRVPYLVAPRGMLVRELMRRKNRWLKHGWVRLFEERTLRQSCGLHATTETEAEDVRALGLHVPAVFCIGNGVEWPSEHSPLRDGPFAAQQRPYALYLGRLNWKKGLDRLITAWAQVPELPLVIAGNDEEGYRATLDRLIAEQRVGDRVAFIGHADDQHKWALYENATCLVLPSYSENFGNVVAEAMAMGCPVVVTPEVGLAPFVREHGAGIVCAGDAGPLSAGVRTLANDPDQRREMGARGRRAVAEELSWAGIAAQMEAAYDAIRERRAAA